MTRSCLVVAVLIFAAPSGAQPMGEFFAPKDGRFTIRFPGKPKEKSETAKSPIGDLKVVTDKLKITQGQLKKARQEAADSITATSEKITALDSSVHTELATKQHRMT